MKLAKIIKRCRIDKPEKFKLSNFDPAESSKICRSVFTLMPAGRY